MDYRKFPENIIEEELFKTSLAEQNWKSKYRYDNETPLGTFKRVAKALASVEQDPDYWYGRFLDMMVKTEEISPGKYRAVGLKNTFGGRITANAGTEYSGTTLMNCYVQLPPRGADISYEHRFQDGTVLPVEYYSGDNPDSLSNIMLALLEMAQTLKSEGGYGINFGFIRPRGSTIKSLGIRHPGVVHYMGIWDTVSNVIVMGDNDGYQDILTNHLEGNEEVGRRMKAQARKGAMMGSLPVFHPDIEEFVRAKQEPGRLTKFNISVLIDNRFLHAVENDSMYDLWFPEETSYKINGESGFVDIVDGNMVPGSAYSLESLHEAHSSDADYYVDPHGNVFTKKVYKRVRARDLYDLIMQSTYNRAEPGILFYDSMQYNNPFSYINDLTSTNPCGEVGGFLTVCLLGNVNLTQYVLPTREFDWEAYKKDLAVFARALDNVNDITTTPLPQYDWAVKNARQYGLGLNGLGSTLIMMGIPFNSDEGFAFAEEAARVREEVAWKTSAELALEKGTFPGYRYDFLETTWFNKFTEISDEVKTMIRNNGVRNAKVSTNAPNGNTSVICDITSNGIEPVFSLEYMRTYIVDRWPEGMTRENITELLAPEEVGGATSWRGEYNGKTYIYEPHNRGLCIIEPVRDYGYQWVLDNYPEDADASYLTTTNTLSVYDHVRSQSGIQKHTSQSVSKTINLPNDYPFEEFKNLYLDAWKSGLNGLTTYRDGSMESVLSHVEETKKTAASLDDVLVDGVKLPDAFTNGDTTVIKRENSKFYIHFSYHPEDVNKEMPLALWVSSNRDTPLRQVNAAVKELVALLNRANINPPLIDDMLEKIKEERDNNRLGRVISMALRHNVPLVFIIEALNKVPDVYVSDLVFAVRSFLLKHVEEGTKIIGMTCDSCGGSNIAFQSSCSTCLDCGASSCS